MNNIGTIIKSHNNKILTRKPETNERKCNCRNKKENGRNYSKEFATFTLRQKTNLSSYNIK